MFIRKQVLIVLALVLFVVAIIFTILNFRTQQQLSSPLPGKQNQKIERTDYPADLQGKVYLTLRDKVTKGTGIYLFDLEKNSLEGVYSFQNCAVFGGELNSAGNEMAISSNCESVGLSNYQIYSNNIKKERTPITKSLTGFKKEAVWSPDDKKVAFMTISPDGRNSSKASFDMNAWNIFTSDLEGNEQFVAGAAHPFFSPDGKEILALREGGIFLFDLETGKGRQVHTFETGASISTQLDLSDKKDRLVISNSIDRNITVFEINSWDTFKMEKIQTIETKNSYVSWPKLHPTNEKYLITEELFDNQVVMLVAYNLNTKEKHFIADLSAYEHSAMWVNDWK